MHNCSIGNALLKTVTSSNVVTVDHQPLAMQLIVALSLRLKYRLQNMASVGSWVYRLYTQFVAHMMTTS
jgi:hypothetical protein